MTGQSSLLNVCKSSKMKDLDAILVYIIQKYNPFFYKFFLIKNIIFRVLSLSFGLYNKICKFRMPIFLIQREAFTTKVVFVSGTPDYAIDAWQYHVNDYLILQLRMKVYNIRLKAVFLTAVCKNFIDVHGKESIEFLPESDD